MRYVAQLQLGGVPDGSGQIGAYPKESHDVGLGPIAIPILEQLVIHWHLPLSDLVVVAAAELGADLRRLAQPLHRAEQRNPSHYLHHK